MAKHIGNGSCMIIALILTIIQTLSPIVTPKTTRSDPYQPISGDRPLSAEKALTSNQLSSSSIFELLCFPQEEQMVCMFVQYHEIIFIIFI